MRSSMPRVMLHWLGALWIACGVWLAELGSSGARLRPQ